MRGSRVEWMDSASSSSYPIPSHPVPTKPSHPPPSMFAYAPPTRPYQHGNEPWGVEADRQPYFRAVRARVSELHVALVGQQRARVAFHSFPRNPTAFCFPLFLFFFLLLLFQLGVSCVPFHSDSSRRQHPFAMAASWLVIHLQRVVSVQIKQNYLVTDEF